jgi:hypothetical protein
MTNPIVPGMTVRVIDEREPPSKWIEFTVIKLRDERVDPWNSGQPQVFDKSAGSLISSGVPGGTGF